MSPKKTQTKVHQPNQVVDEARRLRERREKTYRERALKIFPWICSNWELLCIYCHENEHSRDQVAEWYGGTTPGDEQAVSSGHQPFAALEDLLKNKK
ncbi:MAG: HNH endonuclease [Deltaproteobacteria bacterium]|nr:HNH endonuclease [Deltaproteobacteria bacterium]